jgi:hypothetical protein
MAAQRLRAGLLVLSLRAKRGNPVWIARRCTPRDDGSGPGGPSTKFGTLDADTRAVSRCRSDTLMPATQRNISLVLMPGLDRLDRASTCKAYTRLRVGANGQIGINSQAVAVPTTSWSPHSPARPARRAAGAARSRRCRTGFRSVDPAGVGRKLDKMPPGVRGVVRERPHRTRVGGAEMALSKQLSSLMSQASLQPDYPEPLDVT